MTDRRAAPTSAAAHSVDEPDVSVQRSTLQKAPTPTGATAPVGLSEEEAARLRGAGQGNDVQPHAGRSYAAILWQSVVSPVNVVLFAVSAALVALGLVADAAVTALPVLANVAISAGLEATAKYRLDRLRIVSNPRVTVIRDDRERQIDPKELVRGDISALALGDQVVVDGVLVAGDLEVDESLLTGESDPVVRRAGDVVRSGTVCTSGRGLMRVAGVGRDSYANRLTATARAANATQTPLQRDVNQLIAMTAVLVVIVSAVAAVMAGGARQPAEVVQAAAVLVALVPQGLAIMATVTCAAAAVRISRAGALVQRINAVESISRIDTLVLDKTGTITSAGFELANLEPVEGDEAAIGRLLSALVAEMPSSDRISSAIARWVGAHAELLDSPSGDSGVRLSDVVPFSSARRWSGVVVDGAPRQALVLGGIDLLLPGATSELSGIASRLMDAGDRVLLLASSTESGLRNASGELTLPATVRPVALLGFAEELRPDARETLAAFATAGVELNIVSGDDVRTVAAIARLAGLDMTDRMPAVGGDLENLEDAELAERVQRARIVGRAAPDLKAKIVGAFRRRGRYTAMVGDGVNDIPAIKTAHVGVAMESGSAAARAAADIVLLGDRFGVLPDAVLQGRRIVDGMLAAASLLLTRTLYLLLIVLGGSLAGLAFPFTPRNNAVLALVTVGLPSLALVAWARPAPVSQSFLTATLRFAVPASLAVAAIALPVYAFYLSSTGSVDTARSALITLTVFCGLLLIPVLSRTRGASAGDGSADAAGSRDLRPIVLSLAMAALYGLIAALPLARSFFELAPLSGSDVVALGAIALAWAVAVMAVRRLGVVERLQANGHRLQEPH